jgi:hypothetical protein
MTSRRLTLPACACDFLPDDGSNLMLYWSTILA